MFKFTNPGIIKKAKLMLPGIMLQFIGELTVLGII